MGKNYLDISARESLEPPNEDNLVDILDKARTNKDLIHYHIINSPHFIAGLLQLFRLFQ